MALRGPILSVLLMACACGDGNMKGSFRDQSLNGRCTNGSEMANRSADRMHTSVSVECFRTLDDGTEPVFSVYVRWPVGSERPDAWSGVADPVESQPSRVVHELRDRSDAAFQKTYLDHEVEITRLDLDPPRLVLRAHAWSEDSDFELRYNGSYWDMSTRAE